MLDKLFRFPIVMFDAEGEEKKQKLGLPSDEDSDYDLIIGYAEYPYYDFMGIEDRWIPSKESLANAKEKRFDGCAVKFANVGMMLVPWTRAKFKEKIKDFAEKMNKEEDEEHTDMNIIRISPAELKEILKKSDDNKGDIKPEENGEQDGTK